MYLWESDSLNFVDIIQMGAYTNIEGDKRRNNFTFV